MTLTPGIQNWSLLGEVSKKKIAKRKLEILWEIKAWNGLANSKDMIKRLKVHLELVNAFSGEIRIYQSQKSKKNGKKWLL